MSEPSVVLIVADDELLAEKELSAVLTGAGELDVQTFPPDGEVGDILGALRTSSMFAARRFVLVRGAESLTADSQRALVAYLEDPNPETTLVLVAAKKQAKLAEAAKKAGRLIEVSKGRRGDLFEWLRAEASERGLKVSGDALGALVQAVGEERRALSSALDELSLVASGGRLTPSDVEETFRSHGDVKVFGFVDAVAGRDVPAALELLHRLTEQGESPQRLFWLLVTQIRMMIKAEGPPREVAKALGLPPWRAEKLVRQSRAFSPEELSAAFQALAEADRKMKSSEEPELLTLERTVVSIASTPR